MAQTLLLTVKSYEFDAGTNKTNPMGFMIRILTEEGEHLRMYFFAADVPIPELIGWRASFDGALVLFLQRRDYLSYVTLLSQAKASYIKVIYDEVADDITLFLLSSAQFPTETRLFEEDAAEFEKRSAKR